MSAWAFVFATELPAAAHLDIFAEAVALPWTIGDLDGFSAEEAINPVASVAIEDAIPSATDTGLMAFDIRSTSQAAAEAFAASSNSSSSAE